MIVELDRIIMRIAIKQLSDWQESGIYNGSLSLNLAIKQLEKDDFAEFLQELLKEYSVSTHSIELEVTESGLMLNPEESVKQLNALKELGIKISIDDFGTGYSSLSYIKQLPVSKIKIDKSFINELPENSEDVMIVKTVISLAKNLDLEIIAEGVETKEQNDFMFENECHLIQGYYHSKPICSKDTEEFLKSF